MKFKTVLAYFLTWRVILQIVLSVSIAVLPLQMNFLGGGIANYLKSPYLWAWANFDGEHYLFIAQNGYQTLTHFFFPIYPVLVREMGEFLRSFVGQEKGLLYSGLLISNLAFIVGIIGFAKLTFEDHSEKVVKTALLLLLFFPTAFYFGAVYTEGLFFALIVWSFYFARKGNWLASGILGGIATATRITGIALLPAILVEYFLRVKGVKGFRLKNLAAIAVIPIGIIGYMFYLYNKVGDPLAFFHNLNAVYGEQRSNDLVLLPQVFYRYFFKIIPNINYDYWPVVFTTFLELGSALVVGGIVLLGVLGGFGKLKNVKMRESYLVFSIFAYLIPTFSGSFSSFPRYVLVIFPAFILSAIIINKFSFLLRYTVFLVLLVLSLISVALFSRGYWLS